MRTLSWPSAAASIMKQQSEQNDRRAVELLANVGLARAALAFFALGYATLEGGCMSGAVVFSTAFAALLSYVREGAVGTPRLRDYLADAALSGVAAFYMLLPVGDVDPPLARVAVAVATGAGAFAVGATGVYRLHPWRAQVETVV